MTESDNRDPVLTFRATEAVRNAIAAHRERLERTAPSGLRITQTDALASLILIGALAEEAADDPELRGADGFRWYSAEQLIAAGHRALKGTAGRGQ